MKFCKNCREKLEDSQKFCENCGAKVTNSGVE
ncbi:zinc-ribbon domain-containing protein [Marinilactibacillus psychrotolerans]|nr:zinc-ribbon domain-containing protein [Marinilactibacillus psychrotolerans]